MSSTDIDKEMDDSIIEDSQSSSTTTTVSNKLQNRVKMGDTVILNINNGESFKVMKMVSNMQKIALGKSKNVDLMQIIDQPYFTTFQIIAGKMEKINPKAMEEELNKFIASSESADNSKLTNINTTQKLSAEDISKLKQDGSSASEIIQALIDNSDSFHTKTAFSQIKYLKKKMAKHSTIVKIVKPSLKTLTETYYTKDPRKINNLRADTFGQILTLGNVRAGTNVLVVDTTMGLVTGAVNERMGGDGKVLSAFIGKGASLSIASNFGFSPQVESAIVPFNLELVGQLNSLPDDFDINKQFPETKVNPLHSLNLNRQREAATILKQQGVNSLIIVTKYSPLNILMACLPYLEASGSIVIFSLYKQQLIDCHQFLTSNTLAVNLSLNEIWMREQQVLPKRTHPMMNMDGASGFLLSGIKINPKLMVKQPITPPIKPTEPTTTTESIDEDMVLEETTLKRKRDDEGRN